MENNKYQTEKNRGAFILWVKILMKIAKDLNQFKSHLLAMLHGVSLAMAICYDHRPESSLETFALAGDENEYRDSQMDSMQSIRDWRTQS